MIVPFVEFHMFNEFSNVKKFYCAFDLFTRLKYYKINTIDYRKISKFVYAIDLAHNSKLASHHLYIEVSDLQLQLLRTIPS